MSLSKPLVNALSFYLEQLYMHPLRTKSITSAVLASSASYVSQKIMGCKEINHRSIFAYALFGYAGLYFPLPVKIPSLLFGGSVPHYCTKLGEQYLAGRVTKINPFLLVFLIERLAFTPIFQVLSLYFFGKPQQEALYNLLKMYWPLLKANWTYRSLPAFIIIRYASPHHRVVTGNLISFFWAIFIAVKRRRLQNRLDKERQSRASSSGISKKEL